jgi:hypothetical protein
MNALQVECAISRHMSGVMLIPEAPVRYSKGVQYGWGGAHEHFGDYFADFMAISASGYATELEVKVSLSDWKADLQKPKWTGDAFPAWVTRFIYVVPVELGTPEWVPLEAGIWHVKGCEGLGFPHISVVRSPKRIGKEPLPADVRARWMESLYYRYWSMRTERFQRKAAQIKAKAVTA